MMIVMGGAAGTRHEHGVLKLLTALLGVGRLHLRPLRRVQRLLSIRRGCRLRTEAALVDVHVPLNTLLV